MRSRRECRIGNNKTKYSEFAYVKLKQDAYYDTVNIFLRERIARFEISTEFENKSTYYNKRILVL